MEDDEDRYFQDLRASQSKDMNRSPVTFMDTALILLLGGIFIWTAWFAWRHKWKILALCIAYWIYVRLVTQQTADLSGYIADQQSKIEVSFASGDIQDPRPSYSDSRKIKHIVLRFTNTTPARAYKVSGTCTGHITRTQPDPSYPTVEETTSVDFTTHYGYIAPSETRDIDVYDDTDLSFDIKADEGTIKCKATKVLFEDGDFYRTLRKTDHWGMAGIESTIKTTISDRPRHYDGDDFYVQTGGILKNVGKSVIFGFSLQCFIKESVYRDYKEHFVNFDNVNLAVGERYKFGTKLLVDHDGKPVNDAFCRIFSISQPLFYQ